MLVQPSLCWAFLMTRCQASEVLVQEVIEQLRNWGGDVTTEIQGIEEKVVFSLPRELKG